MDFRKLSPENQEFLKRIKKYHENEGTLNYEMVKAISDNAILIRDIHHPYQDLILKVLELDDTPISLVNIVINSFIGIFDLLGDEYLQGYITKEEKNLYGARCRYPDRFMCYKDFFVNVIPKRDWSGNIIGQKHQLISIYEKIDGEDLIDYSERYNGKIDLRILVNIGYSLLTSLNILHSRGISHRDIKPDNIIYNENADMPSRVKLIDFDFSCNLNVSDCKGNPGTLDYAAKSIILNKKITPEVWMRADVVSAAITLFKLLTYDGGGSYFKDDYVPLDNEDDLLEWIYDKFNNGEPDSDSIQYAFFLVNMFDFDTNPEKQFLRLSDIIEKYEELFGEVIDRALIDDYKYLD